MDRIKTLVVVLILISCVSAYAQHRVDPVASVPLKPTPYVAPAPAPDAPVANQTNTDGISGVPADYVLGPGDQLILIVPDLEEEFVDRTFRIDNNGDVSLPHIGRVHAAGLTAAALEQQAEERLSRILMHPEVTISLVGFGSQPVSILGAVNSPGIRQLEGRRSLFEVLSLAGGLRQDAGFRINITRNMKWGRIPLPGAQVDAAGQFSTASVKVKTIMDSDNTAENIQIFPGDTISVPKADLVYAVGCVTKPGGFLLSEHESISALQVVSLAEGLQKTAAADRARILRTVPGSTNRTEIEVNLKQLMAGRGNDVQLRPDDILFVPNSGAKSAGFRTLDAVINAATGMAIYGRY